jgi:hypothetical protein
MHLLLLLLLLHLLLLHGASPAGQTLPLSASI